MHIEHIRAAEEILADKIKCEFEKGIECVDVCEMAQATDMLKDLCEAEYYARISKTMEDQKKEDDEEEKYLLKRLKEEYGEEEGERRYYDDYRYERSGRFAPKGRGSYMPRRGYIEPLYHMPLEMYHEKSPEELRDMDRADGKMYYTEPAMRKSGDMVGARDGREGRSWQSRRAYMETRELHSDDSQESKQKKMKELEKYMGELSSDLTEMIAGASNEEKTMLKSKLATLTQKIV